MNATLEQLDWTRPDTQLCRELGISRSQTRRIRIRLGKPLLPAHRPLGSRDSHLRFIPIKPELARTVGELGTELRLRTLRGAATMWLVVIAIALFGSLYTIAADFAPHGPPRIETVFIPYEAKFLRVDYYLTAGVTYVLETSEDLVTWTAVTEPYTPLAADVWTPGLAISVNGFDFPRGFMRMRIVP